MSEAVERLFACSFSRNVTHCAEDSLGIPRSVEIDLAVGRQPQLSTVSRPEHPELGIKTSAILRGRCALYFPFDEVSVIGMHHRKECFACKWVVFGKSEHGSFAL